jgi:hypothetical protein
MTATNATKAACDSLILLNGAPEEIRTPDPRIRSLTKSIETAALFCKPGLYLRERQEEQQESNIIDS